ncbi:MAG TPA: carotenoid biosynthesis protein, partial [Rubrobacteraceae bacterium]|nr:carotenoid biosynthesis protein [Rubrobacteraceae bacterium]
LPLPLVAASVLFFCAAYFTVRFPDVPGASAGSYVSTFLIAVPPCAALFRYLGGRRAILSLVALSAFAYAVETTGVVTGFPYGEFRYGDSLGPRVFGLVPYLLPVSYVPLVIGAVAAVPLRRPVPRVLASAVLLTVTDAALDPGAVSLGFWGYPDGGLYYGVPVSNFAGWLLSGTIAAALLLALGCGWRGASPPGLLDGLVIAAAFWSGVAVFSGLILPALIGAILLTYLLYRRRGLAGSHPPGPGRV